MKPAIAQAALLFIPAIALCAALALDKSPGRVPDELIPRARSDYSPSLESRTPPPLLPDEEQPRILPKRQMTPQEVNRLNQQLDRAEAYEAQCQRAKDAADEAFEAAQDAYNDAIWGKGGQVNPPSKAEMGRVLANYEAAERRASSAALDLNAATSEVVTLQGQLRARDF